MKDPQYLPAMLRATAEGRIGRVAMRPYLEAGLDEAMARHMYAFQMSACYSAAMSVRDDAEWRRVQRTIDSFIAGGLEALRRG